MLVNHDNAEKYEEPIEEKDDLEELYEVEESWDDDEEGEFQEDDEMDELWDDDVDMDYDEFDDSLSWVDEAVEDSYSEGYADGYKDSKLDLLGDFSKCILKVTGIMLVFTLVGLVLDYFDRSKN